MLSHAAGSPQPSARAASDTSRRVSWRNGSFPVARIRASAATNVAAAVAPSPDRPASTASAQLRMAWLTGIAWAARPRTSSIASTP